ncbi:OB-fold domain-containing protein [Nocardioides allogilvus]|uniref:OB-fold domain-containing protein n=1 Tax=Nocardioides allogilvus TaxID=2072017 RepID=UPI000D30CEA0|nr:OB-fold domain-containing protein [Nocardioides allogilvus]
MTHEEIMARVDELVAAGETSPRDALDEVNLPMIRHWAEAMGDTNPLWRSVAPPAMTQVWTMYGLDPHRPAGDPLHATMKLLDEAGFTSVLGTNCDQTYARHLVPGERPAITTRLESVVGPKRTGVGEGYFVTTQNTWWVAAPDGRKEPVATMTFRVLKFKPGARVDPTQTVRPVVNRDTAFFFEGTALGELRIQTCNACGVLRHPPGPVCPDCHAMDRGHVVASGRGTVFSFLVHHAPQVPGKTLPLPLALVELEEGVRMVGAVRGEGLEIGAPVQVVFDRIDDDLTLASWSTRDPSYGPEEMGADSDDGPDLPVAAIPVTPTLVVSTALATRDFQDVHHDRDLAVQRGSKDIFLNILTTTGLVQKYVADWAREEGLPDARITACALRLGAPAHPGDTLELTGTIASRTDAEIVVDVVGAVSSGDHVTARVTVQL